MGRLVVVSNRLADPRKTASGGLAVALGQALEASGGLWFGWSGKVLDEGAPPPTELHLSQAGRVQLATLDLSHEEHHSYYLGYSNGVLWPVFHYRLDLADFDAGYFGGYQRVNRRFAQQLATLLRPDDTVWVHDYHLIPLAAELRALGCQQRMGFFLHIPLPPPLILAAVPEHEWLMRALFAYDLLGLQSQADVAHFARYVGTETGADILGEHEFRAFGKTLQVQAFPIGIDVDEFTRLGRSREAQEMFEQISREYSRRRLLLGVERLDYSKGLPQRLKAFRQLLQNHPDNMGSATLIQIAAPSRESVDAYAALRQELESLSGAINGDFGRLDWMPVRYIHRTVARRRLPGLYRAAAVALVTPLRDGMNLVAKEFILNPAVTNPQGVGFGSAKVAACG
jgi:trehalose 6-phosphate synthase